MSGSIIENKVDDVPEELSEVIDASSNSLGVKDPSDLKGKNTESKSGVFDDFIKKIKGQINTVNVFVTLIAFFTWIYSGVSEFAEERVMREMNSRFEEQFNRIDHATHIANLTLYLSLLESKEVINKSDAASLLVVIDQATTSSSITDSEIFGVMLNNAVNIMVTAKNTDALVKLMQNFQSELASYPSTLIIFVRYFFIEYINDYTLYSGDEKKLDSTVLKTLISLYESNGDEGRAEFYKVILASSEMNFDFSEGTAVYLEQILSEHDGKMTDFKEEMKFMLTNNDVEPVQLFFSEFSETYDHELKEMH